MRNFFKYFTNEKYASLTRVISNQNLSSYQTMLRGGGAVFLKAKGIIFSRDLNEIIFFRILVASNGTRWNFVRFVNHFHTATVLFFFAVLVIRTELNNIHKLTSDGILFLLDFHESISLTNNEFSNFFLQKRFFFWKNIARMLRVSIQRFKNLKS